MKTQVQSVDSNKVPYFAIADTAEDFFSKGEKGFKKLPESTKREHESGITNGKVSDPDWYGGETVEELKFENITSFGDPDTLKEFKDNFNELSETIDTKGAFKARKLIATRDKNGIFDFGLASKGLMRKVEWYDPKLAAAINRGERTNPFINYGVEVGVVPADFVTKLDQSSTFTVFVWTENGKQYPVDKRQAGVTAALRENPSLATHFAPGGILTLVKPNKNLKFSSNYDKCYLKFTTTEKNDRTVDLFVVIGGHGGLGSREFAYMTMPGLVVAKILMDSGVKVRISGVDMTISMNDNNAIAASYTIKDYHEGFDWNKMLINAADLRTIRYNVFRAMAGNLIANYPTQKNGSAWTDDDGLYNGRALSKGRDNFKELTERTKTFLLEEQKKGNNKTKTTDRDKMFFSQIGYINTGESKADLFDKARTEIDKLLLEIDFAFNPVESVINRAVEKMKDKGRSDGEIQYDLYNEISQIIKLPTKGEYAVNQKDQQKALDNYNLRVSAVKERLK